MADDRTAVMSAKALESGYQVLWYCIDRVLGQGGFGITYLARDTNLDRLVAIKEYLPMSFAYRYQDFSVKPLTSDHADSFAWGLNSFLQEAQTLAKFDHPNIARVHSVFEHNSTAYMVMEYEHGDSLSALYKQNRGLDQRFFEQVFFPIFEGLRQIHQFGFIHRDIKPANIYIRENGTPVLIDFGSARQTSRQQTGEMTALVSQGYTPLEQYSVNYGEQGPWTDIYALAATLYEGVSGTRPDEALNRSACQMRAKPDSVAPLRAENHPGFTQNFLDAIHIGLTLEPERRPADLDAWLLSFRDGHTAVFDRATSAYQAEPEPKETELRTRIQAPQSVTAPPATATPSSVVQGEDRFDFNMDERAFDQADAGPLTEFRGTPPGQPRPAPASPSAAQATTSSAGSSGSKGKLIGILASVLVLALAVGGGAYWYVSQPDAAGGFALNADQIAALPRPSRAVTINLPKEDSLTRLNSLATLASFYKQASDLAPGDPEVAEGVATVSAELTELGKAFNFERHPDIKQRIDRVLTALPLSAAAQTRLRQSLDQSASTTSTATVLQLIESKKIVSPEGSSVLDQAARLSPSQFNEIVTTPVWQTMMSRLKSAVVDNMRGARFDDAGKLVAAGLAIHPGEADLLQLRDRLTP